MQNQWCKLIANYLKKLYKKRRSSNIFQILGKLMLIYLYKINFIYIITEMLPTHLRNMQIQDIVEENKDLRRKISAVGQLQQCADQLLFKLETAKDSQMHLQVQNQRLKDQLFSLEQQYQNNYDAHAQEMSFVITQHDRLFLQRDLQIQNLAKQVQKCKSLSQEYQWQTKRLKQLNSELANQNQKISKGYQRQILELQRRLKQSMSELNEEIRKRQKQTEQFNQIVRNNQYELNVSKEQIKQLTEIVNKLQKDNILFAQYSKQLQAELVIKEEQFTHKMLAYKQQIENFKGFLEKASRQKQQLTYSTQILAKQLSNSKKSEVHLKSQIESLSSENQRFIILLEQSERSLNFLNQRNNELQQVINQEIYKYKQNATKINEENLILLKKMKDSEQLYESMRLQLKQAVNQKANLQANAFNIQKQLTLAASQLSEKRKTQESNSIRIKQQQSDNKKLSQLIHVLKAEYSNIQHVNSRLKLQLQSYERQRVLLIKNSAPSQINKSLMDQMNKLLANFKDQRQEQARLFKIQKQKIIQKYEYELREVQLKGLKEVAKLKEQLDISRQLQLLSQRNNSIFTTPKY